MPRPKSGNPLWEPIAFKVPHAQLLELRRFADRHHMNISDVLREGMVLRMAQDGVTLPMPPIQRKEYNGYTSVAAEGERPPEMAAVLVDILAQLQTHGEQLAALREALQPQSIVQPAPVAVAVEPAPVVISDKAALVARLHQMRASGLSLSQIAGQLQAEGLPTLSGKGQWQKGTVDKLLRSQANKRDREKAAKAARAQGG